MSDPQLPVHEHDRIFQEKILLTEDLLSKTSLDNPKAIILAGQPGAGKGNLVRAAKGELAGDVVVVDPDALREYHPRIKDFQQENPYAWSGRTHADASQWADELREATIASKKNLIFDTTLSNGPWSAEMINDLQAKGYDVEVRVVASPKLESELGVNERFTRDIDKKGFARYVPVDARDAIYDKIPSSLNTIHAQNDVPIRIFNREGVELYDSRINTTTLPGAALEQAREARLNNPKISERLRDGWKEQVAWHRDLSENLQENPKLDPVSRENLLIERSDKSLTGGVDRLQRDAQNAIEVDHATRISPNRAYAGKALGVLGVATAAYDLGITAEKTSRLREHGNEVGAQSELIHFGARNLGAWGGATLGASAGAIAGVESGPGLLVTGAIGGIVGTVAGDKLAAYLDNRSIYNQEDRQHNTWTFDPEKPNNGWRRTVLADTTVDGVENEIKRTFVAGTDLTNELNFKASSTSVQLMLRSPPTPGDPYRLPADKNDTQSSRETNWVRTPESGQWQREVFGAFVERGMTPRHTETADANRTAELNRASDVVISQNVANSTAAIATRFEAGHAQYGWGSYGAIPEAVTKARSNVDTLLASDGNTYQRNLNGEWKSEGKLYDSHAQGNLSDELNGTRQQLQTYLSRQPELPAPPAVLTPEQKLREMVASTYANAGVPRTQEQLETATLAVERQHQLKAVGTAYGMTLLADSGTPAYSATSAIATLQQNAEGIWTPKAITTAQDIQRVIQEQAPAIKPGQAKPNNNDVPHMEIDKPKSPSPERSSTSFTSPPGAELGLDPRDRNHPDHALYQQALAGVHQHDVKLGRIPDEKSEQMAASLTALAKENGMTRIDHVVFSADNGRGVKAGENVFVVQGEMGNPAADRAFMRTDVAVNASVQSSFQQLESINQKQAQEVLVQQQSQQHTQQAQVQQQSGGAAMRSVG